MADMVVLKLGDGHLSITFDGNLFTLSRAEREFLNDLMSLIADRKEALALVNPD